jgi:hypothetical protein
MKQLLTIKNSVVFSPQANYTDRATVYYKNLNQTSFYLTLQQDFSISKYQWV